MSGLLRTHCQYYLHSYVQYGISRGVAPILSPCHTTDWVSSYRNRPNSIYEEVEMMTDLWISDVLKHENRGSETEGTETSKVPSTD